MSRQAAAWVAFTKPIRWVILMPTLFFVGSFRVVIFTNDHKPAHVHALGPNGRGHAKFELGGRPKNVALVETHGIKEKALRKIGEEIINRHNECRTAWKEIHGN